MCLHISSPAVVQSTAARAAGRAGQVKPGTPAKEELSLVGMEAGPNKAQRCPQVFKGSYVEVGLERPV